MTCFCTYMWVVWALFALAVGESKCDMLLEVTWCMVWWMPCWNPTPKVLQEKVLFENWGRYGEMESKNLKKSKAASCNFYIETEIQFVLFYKLIFKRQVWLSWSWYDEQNYQGKRTDISASAPLGTFLAAKNNNTNPFNMRYALPINQSTFFVVVVGVCCFDIQNGWWLMKAFFAWRHFSTRVLSHSPRGSVSWCLCCSD